MGRLFIIDDCALSLWVKRPGHEVDHSHPSSAEVKNAWTYTSNPHKTPSWNCAQLNHRDNSTFTFIYRFIRTLSVNFHTRWPGKNCFLDIFLFMFLDKNRLHVSEGIVLLWEYFLWTLSPLPGYKTLCFGRELCLHFGSATEENQLHLTCSTG
jgi:hypothetical protein